MAKPEKKSKNVTSKKPEPVKGKPASSKEILAKAAALSKSTSKKPQPESSGEESDSSDEEMAPPPSEAAPAKNESSDASSDESSSDESESSGVKTKKTSASAKAAPAKGDSSSSEESSGEGSDSDEEKAPPPAKATPTKNASSDTSSSEESSSEESDSSDEEMAPPPAKAAPAKADPSESSEESSSEESDTDDDKTTSAPVKTAAEAKKTAESSDESSDASSSEESSSEENEKPSVANGSIANKKRKTDNEAPIPPKKVKLANGEASATTSGEETKSIFVGRLSWNVGNDWLAQEFAECGEVESAHVQMDRNTGRSRGFGYVHFKSADAVEKALAMNGKEIDGRAVNIDKSSPRDKKASGERRAQAFGDTASPPSTVLFVGNLSFSVNEDALWETFGEHGDVKSVRVPTDRETGKPKGFAYVEFSDVEIAKKAYKALQGFELEGRSIRLDFSQPRDGPGGRGGGQGGRGGRGGRGGFGGDRGRGGNRGGRGGDRGGRGRGRGGARSGGIAQFEGQKITFD